MNCHKSISNNSCTCSCWCGNSSLDSSPGTVGQTQDTGKCDLFCTLRAQELLSTMDEVIDSDIIKRGRCKRIQKELTMELGSQMVLNLENECWEGSSVFPFTWECSNSKVILVSPTQSLSQAQIMALAEGTAEVKATCVFGPCERVIVWKIIVKKKEENNINPPSNDPCDSDWCDCSPCHPSTNPEPCCEGWEGWGEIEEWKIELKKGGSIVLPFNLCTTQPIIFRRETWLDLRGHEITTHRSFKGGEYIITERDGSIRNGSLKDKSDKGNFVIVISQGSFTLENLKIFTTKGIGVNVMDGGEVSILSGEYTCEEGPALIQSQGGKVNIFGGTFDCRKGETVDILSDPFREVPDENLITIQGGKFLGYNPKKYVPKGYHVEVEDTGFDIVYTVLPDKPHYCC